MEPLKPTPNEQQFQTAALEIPVEIPLAFREDDDFQTEFTTTEPPAGN